ncbi:MAG: arsenic resistance protein [Geoalkalibacter sp.]|uniref:arsenic resistance protein n=1 Tax=Geoalkalibacter sp. TaxID=3041440 RepID=UPI003D11589A
MWRLLARVNQNLILAIPVMMLAGFAVGVLFEVQGMRSLIIPLTFLMVYPMMVNPKIKKVFQGGDFKAQWLTQALNFGVVPFLGYGIAMLAFPDRPYMALGLVLASLVPTSGMTISWTGFAKGNLEAAVKMTVIGLTLGSLATPFYVQWLLGAQIAVDMGAIMVNIALIVFLPMAAGFATQQFLVRHYGQQAFQQELSKKFPPLSTLGVLGIVFIAMALKAKAIAAEPVTLLLILLPLLGFYFVNFALSTLVGKWFLPRADAIALLYGSVMRNLSIALAIAMTAFGPAGSDAALVIAAAYIIQVQSAAWFVRLTDRVFGPAAEGQAQMAAAVQE